jgi:hypothetical protein
MDDHFFPIIQNNKILMALRCFVLVKNNLLVRQLPSQNEKH